MNKKNNFYFSPDQEDRSWGQVLTLHQLHRQWLWGTLTEMGEKVANFYKHEWLISEVIGENSQEINLPIFISLGSNLGGMFLMD